MFLQNCDLSHFRLYPIRHSVWLAENAKFLAQLTIVNLELLFAVAECLDFFGELLMILLGELSSLLELLVLGLVLLEHVKQLLLLLELHLGLFFVRLDLFLELFGLGVDLGREGVLDAALLAVLLTQLGCHELHFLSALLLQLLVLHLQVSRLFLDQLVLLF